MSLLELAKILLTDDIGDYDKKIRGAFEWLTKPVGDVLPSYLKNIARPAEHENKIFLR